MDGSLNQPCRVQEDGSMSCKLLLYEGKRRYVYLPESIVRIRIGELRASSLGNTEDPSVIRIYWV